MPSRRTLPILKKSIECSEDPSSELLDEVRDKGVFCILIDAFKYGDLGVNTMINVRYLLPLLPISVISRVHSSIHPPTSPLSLDGNVTLIPSGERTMSTRSFYLSSFALGFLYATCSFFAWHSLLRLCSCVHPGVSHPVGRFKPRSLLFFFFLFFVSRFFHS
jgi:hypothetical protein